MVKREKKQINLFLCEFRNKELEKEYFNYYMSITVKYVRAIIVILGIIFMLFIIPDYYFITAEKNISTIIVIRSAVMLMLILLYYKIKKIKDDYTVLPSLITICEIVFTIAYLIIISQYESIDFFMKSFDLIIILLAIFLLPNKWKNMMFASLFITISFFLYAFANRENIYNLHIYAGIVYTIIIFLFNSIISYRTCYYRRVNYIKDKELQRLSHTDSLTGLYNRAKFNEEFEKLLNIYKRYKTPVSIILLDFDDFKYINDNYGHIAGDKVIVETITLINSIIRKTDIFARWGGEEFVILLSNTNKNKAEEFAERIRMIIENYKFAIPIKSTCSFGVTQLEENDDINSIFNRADKLMYLAKKTGKNKVMS